MASRTYQLVMRTGPTPGRIYPLDQDEIHIGRDISNDVVISDAEVSRHHARLIAQGNSYVLEDQGSTNGTFVDGQRLMGPHLMHPGEVILFGENVSLAFEPGVFDPDATRAAHIPVEPQYRVERWPEPETPEAPVIPPPPVSTYEAPAAAPQPAVQRPTPAPVYQAPAQADRYEGERYTGSVPPGPVETYPAQEERSSRTWFLVGCGALVVLLCILAAGLYAFDTLNLYCTPPFSGLFNCP